MPVRRLSFQFVSLQYPASALTAPGLRPCCLPFGDHGHQESAIARLLWQFGCDDHLRWTVHCCPGVIRLDEADFMSSVHHNAAIRVGKVALYFSFRLCLLRVRYLRVVPACLFTRLRFRFNSLPLSLFFALSALAEMSL